MTRIGYVLKVYPRFSETFVVTEMLARQDLGQDQRIYALRPTTDTRFHPEIAYVEAPVSWVPRPRKASEMWNILTSGLADDEMRTRFAALMPAIASLPADDVAQGIALALAAREDGITHLHAHFASLAGRTAWIASSLSGIPFTVTTHAKDIYHESVDVDLLRRICADAAQVIAISQYNMDYLGRVLEGTGARLVLQRNALELARFPYRDPEPATGTLRVVAVGRLVEKKGFADLIDALAILRDQGVAIDASIIGEGDLTDDLARRIEERGLTPSCRLCGARTQSEVREALEGADVFVAPCIPGSDGNIDGLPTVILESMAVGTPVVATVVTAIPEVIINGRSGVLLPPGSPESIAQALADIASGATPVVELARGARALIEEHYDSRRQASALARLESDEETL